MSTLATLLQPQYPWYAVRTRSKFERIAFSAFTGMGYHAYLPTFQTRRTWSDRVVAVDWPLFPGYVFCRFDRNNRLPVLKVTGVVDILGVGREPEPIPDHEISNVETMLRSGCGAEPWPYVQEGDKIRIKKGSMQGLEGILVQKKKQWKVVVSVTLLQRSVAVEVDRDWVVAVR